LISSNHKSGLIMISENGLKWFFWKLPVLNLQITCTF